MRRTISVAALVMAFAVFGAVPALAEEGVSEFAPGTNADGFVLFYGEGGTDETGSPSSDSGYVTTLGGAISGGFYGNTSNSGADSDAPDSGHGVTPSVSPGPSTGGCVGVVEGASIGYFITSGYFSGVGKGPSAVGHAYDPDC